MGDIRVICRRHLKGKKPNAKKHVKPLKPHVSHAGRHILLTGSRSEPNGANRSYSGHIGLSTRLQTAAVLTGISPQLAPGLTVGDYLVVCSDYTGTTHDPYTGAGAGPVAVRGNAAMAPLFYQAFAALKSDVLAVTATMTDAATVTLHAPEGLSGADGGSAFVSVLPETTAGWGTYIFRIIRIVDVPTNPAVAYSGDIYELGVTINDARLLLWGAA